MATTSTTATTAPAPPPARAELPAGPSGLDRVHLVLQAAAEAEAAPAPEPPPATAPPAPKPAPTGAESETAQLFAWMNQYRVDNGLEPLARAGDASAKAKGQSDAMAAEQQVSHSGSVSSGLEPGWHAAGENVGT